MTTPRTVLLASVLLCLVVCVQAQPPATRQAADQEEQKNEDKKSDGGRGVIDAVVAEVQGTTLKLEGGLVFDISRALVRTIGNEPVTLQPGMQVRITTGKVDAAAPVLPAEYVRVQVPNEIILSGLIQEADTENGVITLLNRRVLITNRTTMPGGFKLRKLKPGLLVSVVVQVGGGGDPVALVMLPNADLPTLFP